MNLTKTDKKTVNRILHNGSVTIDTKETCVVFNKYFSTIVAELVKNIDSTRSENSYQKYYSNTISNSMFCKPIVESELISLRNSLNSNKAAGPDNIGPKRLNIVASAVVSPYIASHLQSIIFCWGCSR